METVDIPELLIPIEISWTFWNVIWMWVLPFISFVSAVILWFYAEKWGAPGGILASKLFLTPEHIRYISLFGLAFAFQNWSTFTGAFKISKE
jgi:hypothetical protein